MKNTKRIIAALFVVLLVRVVEAQTTETAPPEKKLPMPGEVFRVEGRTAFVIPPEKKSDGATPWVWYAPTLPNLPGTEERWMFERFTKAGQGHNMWSGFFQCQELVDFVIAQAKPNANVQRSQRGEQQSDEEHQGLFPE